MALRKRHIILTSIVLFAVAICLLALGCNNDQPVAVVTLDGKALSKKYCQSCHQYPDAGLLDQETWGKHVLPAMARRLGIAVYAEDQYVNDPLSKSTLGYEDWLKIVNYYKTAAPKTLKPTGVPVAPVKDMGVFSLLKPSPGQTIATTSLVAFDSISHRIFTSDGMARSISQWSSRLKLLSSQKYSSPAVDVSFSKDAFGAEQGLFTFIGSMDAIDVSNGFVTNLPVNDHAASNNKPLADKLPRPVKSREADMDNDGLPDLVVCGFGHNAGGLYWYKQLPGKQYEKRIISTIPGAEYVEIGDYDHDGWPDIMCLFAQAEEGVWLFLNNHKGSFTTHNLLRLPPVYGSSSFQLVDFNHDGRLDILYTSGDNSDYSRILKPYHGVYIFLNQGNFKYKQAYFYPVNGATKAVAADFNGDGKLDIALIAFFSDLKNNPEEGFTYFEQDSPLHFIPHNLPIAKHGRWICMDVADYDADGKPDIILGNYSFGFINQPDLKPDWDAYTPFVILKNISHQAKRK